MRSPDQELVPCFTGAHDHPLLQGQTPPPGTGSIQCWLSAYPAGIDYRRMTDTLTTDQRSARMRLIRGKDTTPELVLRRLLHRMGYRYRLHASRLPGKPDIVFSGRRKVIFVHGCFWHGHEQCSIAHVPKSRSDYWREKFHKNRQRDATSIARLAESGWSAMVVWECELPQTALLAEQLKKFLGPPRYRFGEN